MQSSDGLAVRTIALEVFFLVVAVFFALAVDEAWENHEQALAADLALQRIIKEIEQNRELIRSESESHMAELSRLQPVIDQLTSGDGLPEEFEFNPNINVSILRDTAWETASLTGVLKDVPYNVVERLTAVYSLQELYRDQSRLTFEKSASIEFIAAQPESQLRSIHRTLLNLYAVEQALLGAYEGASGDLSAGDNSI